MEQQVEFVARALHGAEYEGSLWVEEPESLKEDFRNLARTAIALLDKEAERQQAGESKYFDAA